MLATVNRKGKKKRQALHILNKATYSPFCPLQLYDDKRSPL